MKWRAKQKKITKIVVSAFCYLAAFAPLFANAQNANSEPTKISVPSANQPFALSGSEQLRPNVPPIRHWPISTAQIIFWIVIAVLIVLFFFIGLGIWRWWKWRNRPWNIAFREIDSLTVIAAEQENVLFHDGLNQILRRYFTKRFGWRGLRRTTQELLAAANREPSLTTNQREQLSQILNAADCAKFANRDLSNFSKTQIVSRETLLAESRDLIKTSIPQRSAQNSQKKLRKIAA